MHDLIIGALQKGRINRRERPHPLRRQSGREGHRMLLGDPDVEGPRRMRFREFVDARPRRHRGGDRDDPFVGFGQLRERFAKDILILRRARRRFRLLAGDDVEFLHAMIFVGGGLGGGIALALYRHRMDQHRPMVAVAHIFEDRDQMLQIMPVDRPDIIKSELLEQGAAHRHAASELVGLLRRLVERFGQLARNAPRNFAQFEERPRRHQLRQIGRKSAHRRRDRHVIVVEDHDQPVACRGGVVHRLIGHARRHRSVANHRDRAPGLILQLVRDCKAERGADRRRAVRRAERIIFTLAALGEARQAAAGAACGYGRAAR